MSMSWRRLAAALVVLLTLPATAWAAAESGPPPALPLWSAVPFLLLLLCIAVLPLAAGHWWHSNRNKGLVAAALALPTGLYLVFAQLVQGLPTLHPLHESILEYASFIILLGSLYVVAGGIVISGDPPAGPLTNTGILALGAVLTNLIGTTGASVLFIRPLLRINRYRKHRTHLPVFFIFTVSNVGGLLTPLGDPPLFLGFLNEVPFEWTLTLWPQWLVVNGSVLAIFHVWDTLALRRESGQAVPASAEPRQPIRVEGLINLLFLAGVIGAVLLQGQIRNQVLREVVPPALMLAMGALSLAYTPQRLRQANAFTWEPIIEVAVLFAGIFVTMVPALAILEANSARLGEVVSEPWQYFWLTGLLSGCLDNAPTYVTFAKLASGSNEIGWLAGHNPRVLSAISCGAVFMGALTYIGNGPNFMVKAIAEEAGYKMPSFFGYVAYSCLVLLPVMVVVTVIFFRPG
jgi:Na+/H+ antiporter NhaD/arsenite permease-like protein